MEGYSMRKVYSEPWSTSWKGQYLNQEQHKKGVSLMDKFEVYMKDEYWWYKWEHCVLSLVRFSKWRLDHTQRKRQIISVMKPGTSWMESSQFAMGRATDLLYKCLGITHHVITNVSWYIIGIGIIFFYFPPRYQYSSALLSVCWHICI